MRAFLSTALPIQTYNAIAFPNARPAARGRLRPYWFGYETNVSPERVDLTASTGLGIYELLDPTIAPNTSVAIYTTAGALDHVWNYENLEAAAAKDPLRRKELVITTDYTLSASLAQITLVRNPYIVRIVPGENDRLDFNANAAGPFNVDVTPGIYTIHELKSHLQTIMNTAVGGAVFTWTFNESNLGAPFHKYAVSYSGGGAFVMLIDTGTNRDRSVFKTIGFTGDTDLTGASQTADTAMPYDPDTVHHIRVDNWGYRDDSVGTYTGVSNGPILLAPDIDRVLLLKVHRENPANISASYVTARTTCPQEQSVYLGGLTSVGGGDSFSLTHADVRDRFEAGCGADIITDASGAHTFIARSATVPSTAKTFHQWDYLSWWVGLSVEHVYAAVRVNFAQDPTTGFVQGRETTNVLTLYLFHRPQMRTFDTFLRYESDAANALSRLAALARQPIRHPSFTVVGRGAEAKVGDITVLTRERSIQGFEETGGLSDDPFRMLAVSKNPHDGTVSYTTHTNVLI